MTGDEATIAVVDVLERISVPYMLVGSMSTNFYGTPRSTNDADFVVELGDCTMMQICRELGDGFEFDPQMSFERVTGTSRHILCVKGSAFKIELFMLSDDPHDLQRFARRRRAAMDDRKVWLPAVEDVVITKLRWAKGAGRSKDLEDLKDVIEAQHERIDWDYVHHWCQVHGTRGLLDEIVNRG